LEIERAVDFTFRPGTVMSANSVLYVSPDVASFRARTTGPRGGQGLFCGWALQRPALRARETINITDDLGRLLATNSYAGQPSLPQQFLRITELMYHPGPLAGNTNGPEEFEYVEFKNISTNLTLNLTGVRFTNGIDFTFTGSAITLLGPGQTVLSVKNLAAFTARYGALANIAGQYGGYLNNGASGSNWSMCRANRFWTSATTTVGIRSPMASVSLSSSWMSRPTRTLGTPWPTGARAGRWTARPA